MIQFSKAVREFIKELNAKKVMYDSEEYDDLVDEFFPSTDSYEFEMFENYTGPPLDWLDDAAARGRGDECVDMHRRSRRAFFSNGSLDILMRVFDMSGDEEHKEKTMTIGWDMDGRRSPAWSLMKF